MSKENIESNKMNNSEEEFDLFAKEVDDNLQEQLAKGSYRWTNKYTAVLGVLVIVTASASGGIWYGNKHSSSSAGGALAGFASRARGAAAGGAFTGAPDPAALAAGAAAAGGFVGAGGAGGFGGGARITGTVTKVNGTTVTITLDAAPATPVATGDSVSVRVSAAGAAAGGAPASVPATGSNAAATGKKGTSATGTTGTSTTTKPTVGGAAAGPAGAPQGAGGGGGGRFNNPEFLACLTKNGVTLAAGARPDRTDPKIAAALQACASTLGLPAAGGGGGRAARPTPTATP